MLLSAVGSGLALTQSPGVKNFAEYKAAQREQAVQRAKTAQHAQQYLAEGAESTPESQLAFAEQTKAELAAEQKTAEAKYKAGLGGSPKQYGEKLYRQERAAQVAEQTIANLEKEIARKEATKAVVPEREKILQELMSMGINPERVKEVKKI